MAMVSVRLSVRLFASAMPRSPSIAMGYGAAYAYDVATGVLPKVEKPVIKTQAVLVNGDNVKEYKAMFIDGMPKYDFTDLKFCVLSDYASFADLAAATAK